MDSRVAVAIQILVILSDKTTPAPSYYLASQTGTDPSRVRQLLALLAAARLTQALLGPGGGARLARPAASVTLADVQRAIQGPGGPRFPVELAGPQRGRAALAEVVERAFTTADDAAMAQLTSISIADVATEMRRVLRGR